MMEVDPTTELLLRFPQGVRAGLPQGHWTLRFARGHMSRYRSFWRQRSVSRVALGVNAGPIAYLCSGRADLPTWQYGTFLLLGFLLGLSFGVARVNTNEDRREGSTSGAAPVSRTQL